jgi:hypothetical protein
MYRIAHALQAADPGPLALTAAVVVFVSFALSFALVVKHAFDTKTYGAPVVAAAALLAYELCFLFVWPEGGALGTAAETFGGLMAVLMLGQAVLYAEATMVEKAFQRNALTVVLWAAGACLAVLWALVHYAHLTDGLIPGVIVLTAIAVLYPSFALLNPDAQHISRGGQALRVLADAGLAASIWIWVPFAGAATIADPSSLNCVLVDVLLCVALFSDLVLLTFLFAPRKG